MSRHNLTDAQIAAIQYEAARRQHESDDIFLNEERRLFNLEISHLQQQIANAQYSYGPELERLRQLVSQQNLFMQTQQGKIEELKTQNDLLRKENEALKKQDSTLRQKLQEITAEMLILERKIAELTTEKDLSVQLQQLQQQVHVSGDHIQSDEITALKDEIRRQRIASQYAFWSLDNNPEPENLSDSEYDSEERPVIQARTGNTLTHW